ncbi:GNAT family N-acetyltransferase [Shewanella gaetbuli]|uniref:GNAT family N-acetyltransferase n=1 Tax=Shewanella gaetbuli TaxID=220752 RepID=A0A9X2CH54_9GAMM|nr:GNAT family N-acetyltransferase [Shewanella gaetbuli]MCL1143118.1 GNAT family N-acetyltransferase [Shewanella gaetbuli]
MSQTIPQVIETSRLTLSMLTLNDQSLLFELDQDVAVTKYINGGKKTTMEQIENVFMPRFKQYYNPQKGHGLWKVSAKDMAGLSSSLENDYLGWILIRPMYFFNQNRLLNNLEIGWRFKHCTWGQGIATEAAQAIVDLMATQDEVEFITAIADEENIASLKVMEKLGMTFLKKEIFHDPLGDFESVFYQKEL